MVTTLAWYKDYSHRCSCQYPFLCDLREESSKQSLVYTAGQTRTELHWLGKHQANGRWAVWGVVPAPDGMSAENQCNGQAGGPASPAQACTCRWCKALRGLLQPSLLGSRRNGVQEWAGWNSLPSHIPAMTVQKHSWEANTARPQQLLAIAFSPWCSAKGRGEESGRPELSSGGPPGRSSKALWGRDHRLSDLVSPAPHQMFMEWTK